MSSGSGQGSLNRTSSSTTTAHFHALLEPLHRALIREASGQLQELCHATGEIGTQEEHPVFYAALNDAAATLSSPFRHACSDLPIVLFKFIQEAHAESGKALTKGQSDRLIALAFRVGRSLGLPW